MSVLSNLTDKARKQVGVFFIVFAVLAAFTTLPSANEAKSPILYVVIVGGIFIAPPAAVGIGLLTGRLGRRK
jgi:hypothetical protein